MTTDATQVTQADREAAERLWNYYGPFQWGTIAQLSQAFARHREATTATLTAPVEALTAERDALREALGALITETDGLNYVCNQSDGPAIIAARAALASDGCEA